MPSAPPLAETAPGVRTPVGAAPPESEPAGGTRRGRRFPWIVAVFAVVAAAFASGWAIAENRANDRIDEIEAAVAAPEVTDVPAVNRDTDEPAEGAEADEPAVVTPPAAEPDVGGEPAAVVADQVAPAVVLIEVAGFGQGSGIIYDAEGHIVTNAHVVGAATEVRVRLASGRLVDGVVVGANESIDVAVIKIDAGEDFVVPAYAADDTVAVGQMAVAIGSPFGLEQSVTAGIVSAVDRVVDNTLDGTTNPVSMIQTDAPINPGNSGGALADREGRVIGMNTSIRTDGTSGNIGVGFAIPADTIRHIADLIIGGEPVELGFLGVNLQEPVIGDPGALIASVNPGSPAAAAGIRTGDLVVGMAGEPVRGTAELAARVRITRPGTVVDIEVVRDGQTVVVPTEIGSLGDN